MKKLLALLKGTWIFGLLAWGYVAASVLDPATLMYQTDPLSYYIPIPTDLFGDIAFGVAFAAFVAWEALK